VQADSFHTCSPHDYLFVFTPRGRSRTRTALSEYTTVLRRGG
jgi:hypothetical protein